MADRELAHQRIFARQIFELAERLLILERGAVEFGMPTAPAAVKDMPEILRRWAAEVAGGQEF